MKSLKSQILDFVQSLNRPVTRGELIQFFQALNGCSYNPTENRGVLSEYLNCGVKKTVCEYDPIKKEYITIKCESYYIKPGSLRRPTKNDNRYLIRARYNTWVLMNDPNTYYNK